MTIRRPLFLLSFFLLLLSANCQLCNTDVLFILDASGSVGGDFTEMIDYIVGISQVLTLGPNLHQVAILEFSSEARASKWPYIKFGQITSTEQFISQVKALPYLRGTTDAGLALGMAIDRLLSHRRFRGLTLIYVVTDGFYRDYDRVLINSARIRRLPNLMILAVAVPRKYNFEALTKIAGSPNSVIAGGNVLTKSLDILLPLIGCQKPTTTTTTIPTTTTPLITGCELDLVFVVDFSGSVDGIHQQYIDLLLNMLDFLIIEPHHTRVAMVKYSGRKRAQTVFHLGKHNDVLGVRRDMQRTSFLSGTTCTGAALEYSMKEFDRKNGARPELAKKVVVLFSDGYSQEDPNFAAAEMRAADVEIYAVAVQNPNFPPNIDQLNLITNDRELVFTDETFDRLIQLVARHNQNCLTGRR